MPRGYLRGLVLGAIGGFLGWAVVELLGLSRDEVRVVNPSSWDVAALGGLIGLFDGLALGIGEGITAGTKSKFLRAVGVGAATGVLAGSRDWRAGNGSTRRC